MHFFDLSQTLTLTCYQIRVGLPYGKAKLHRLFCFIVLGRFSELKIAIMSPIFICKSNIRQFTLTHYPRASNLATVMRCRSCSIARIIEWVAAKLISRNTNVSIIIINNLNYTLRCRGAVIKLSRAAESS